MNGFEGFLNPRRKENLRFVLSDDHVGEDGKPLVWEMRQLSALEGLELERQFSDKSEIEVMIAMAAASLVTPNLKDAALLERLSEKGNKTILSPSQALKSMLTMAELVKLIKLYHSYNGLDESMESLVEKAKN